MEKNQVLKLVAAVITTVDEVNFAPESMVYLGLGVNLDQWYTIKGMMTGAGLVTAQYDTLTITPAGHALAQKINAAMEGVK